MKNAKATQKLIETLNRQAQQDGLALGVTFEDWICRIFFMELESLLLKRFYRQLDDHYPIPTKNYDLDEATQWYLHYVHTSEPFSDLLSPVYSQLQQQGVIAPETLSGSLTDLLNINTRPDTHLKLFQSEEPKTNSSKITYMCDPLSGCGSSVLSQATNLNQSNSLDYLNQFRFMIVDVDETLVQIATIQLVTNIVLHNIPFGECVSYVGNALRPKSIVPIFASTLGHLASAETIPTLSQRRFHYIESAAHHWKLS